MSEHPARRPVADARELTGVAWLELGGDPSELEAHVGAETFQHLPLRFVPRPAGLYGVGIATADGDEIAIRAESAAPELAVIAAGPA